MLRGGQSVISSARKWALFAFCHAHSDCGPAPIWAESRAAKVGKVMRNGEQIIQGIATRYARQRTGATLAGWGEAWYCARCDTFLTADDLHCTQRGLSAFWTCRSCDAVIFSTVAG